MSRIQELIRELDELLIERSQVYIDLHKEFDRFRGKPIEDVDVVNKILEEIQDTFRDMYPAYHFIGERYPTTVKIVEEYDAFIQGLTSAGAKIVEREG